MKPIRIASLFQQSIQALSTAWPYGLVSLAVSLAVQSLLASTGPTAMLCLAALFCLAAAVLGQLLFVRAVLVSLDGKPISMASLSENMAAPIVRVLAFGVLVGAVVGIPAGVLLMLIVAAVYQLNESLFLACAGVFVLLAVPLWFYLSSLTTFVYNEIVHKDKDIKKAFTAARELLHTNWRQLAKVFSLTSLPLTALALFVRPQTPASAYAWLAVSALAALFVQTLWLAAYHQIAKKTKRVSST